MNPYSNQPPKAFWRRAVSDVSPMEIADIYEPRFKVDKSMRIVAAGSCFAQHIGSEFKKRGFHFIDAEPAPDGLPDKKQHDFGFDMYSARFGNLYSVRQLVQLFARASGDFKPKEVAWVEADGRVRDPFRPSIEPDGFASLPEMRRDRAYHLGRVRTLLRRADVFVFTFGLTEAWECVADGAILPTCPGTVGGTFDARKYRFKNFTYPEVWEDAESFIKLALSINPDMKFLFTVSPVPLTATATDDHVLSATVYSKSVLRAVCGDLRAKYPMVDYFPSFELVSSHPMRAMYFMPNLRSVATAGVAQVMNVFFKAHQGAGVAEDAPVIAKAAAVEDTSDDVVCDEAILEAFGR
ncbi:MAG: GSCFA domain-containing protein [Cypionkella sp.]